MTPLLELEGTWDEIKAQLPEFASQRLHVTIRPAEKSPAPLDSALEEIWESVPEESWAQFPPDFVENMDGYLYGVPRP